MKPSPLEKTFQAKVTKKLKTLRHTWFCKVSDRAKSGIPDIIMCVNGKFVALELKRDEKSKATPLQLYNLEQITHAHGKAIVVHPGNWEIVWTMLEHFAGGTKDKKHDKGYLRANQTSRLQCRTPQNFKSKNALRFREAHARDLTKD